MRKTSIISGFGLILAACATTGPANLPVPEAASIKLPENAEAAAMTVRFTGLMEKKLPMLDRLAVITARDQYVRKVLVPMFSDEALDPEVRTAFQSSAGAYLYQVDTLNTAELKVILQEYSWADLIEGDPQLFKQIFHVVQHSPDEAFRAEVLAEISPYAERGDVDGQEYALMYDRVELAAGRQQLYGSQYKCVDGQYDVYDLKDPEGVDARRALMGMQPLQDYLEQGRDFYGPCSDD
jgi:hypothetical protein